jgi:site-specific DNA-methyltransferase (adenine-specific)
MEPYYEHAGITIYHGDCRDMLPSVTADSIVTDPPYGLGERWTGGTWFTRGVYQGAVEWDGEAPQDVVDALLARAVPTVLWGGNYFVVPPSRCWLVWSKTNAVPTMADFEAAWTNLDRPSKTYSSPCNGWKRSHPTEKPQGLMSWCLGLVPGSVLDPFMGSGTTLVAAKRLGRKAIGIEREEKYCEIAAKRLQQEALPFAVGAE